jgi:hypothetical protein
MTDLLRILGTVMIVPSAGLALGGVAVGYKALQKYDKSLSQPVKVGFEKENLMKCKAGDNATLDAVITYNGKIIGDYTTQISCDFLREGLE